MRKQYIVAVSSIIFGLGIIGSWAVILISDQMPELHTAPMAAMLHISAELMTAAFLLLSGYGLLANRWWSQKMQLISMGMLLYAIIQASGHYIQQRAIGMLIVFTIITALTIVNIKSAFTDCATIFL